MKEVLSPPLLQTVLIWRINWKVCVLPTKLLQLHLGKQSYLLIWATSWNLAEKPPVLYFMYIAQLLWLNILYQFLESRWLQGLSWYFWKVIRAPRKSVPLPGLTSFQAALKNNQYHFKRYPSVHYRSIQSHNTKSTSLPQK